MKTLKKLIITFVLFRTILLFISLIVPKLFIYIHKKSKFNQVSHIFSFAAIIPKPLIYDKSKKTANINKNF